MTNHHPPHSLCDLSAPYIISLVQLMETQSKAKLTKWCVQYAQVHILPIYEKLCGEDVRVTDALQNALSWTDGKVKYLDARRSIAEAQNVNTCGDPVVEAALRTITQAALSIHVSAHALGLVFYGTAAIAYDRVGIDATADIYEPIVTEECGKMEAALRSIAVTNDPNPAKIDLWIWPLWRLK